MTDHAQTVRKALVAGAELAPAYAPDFGRAGAALDALVAERDEAKKAWWNQRNEWAVATGKNMDVMEALEARAEAAEAALVEARQDTADVIAAYGSACTERDALAAALRTCADAIEDIKGDVYLHALGSIDADTALSGISKSLQAVREIPSVSPSTQADVADQ